MGLFNFFKSNPAPAPKPAAPSEPEELFFKSGKDAVEYIKNWMRTEWQPGEMVMGLLGPAELIKGTLCAKVLVPHGDGFVQLATYTPIKEVDPKGQQRIPVGETTPTSMLGLNSGDLVTVLLADRKPELFELLKESFDGWVGFVVAKNELTYSFRAGGWLIEKRYELR